MTVTRDPERYQQELTRLLGPGRVAIATAWYSRRQLEDLQDRVSADFDALNDLGIEPSSVYVGDAHRVVLEFFSQYQHPMRELLTERYGPALDPVWRGPSIAAAEPQPFGSWISEGRRLTVFYFLDINGHRPGGCTVDERDNRVVVDLTVIKPQGLSTLAGGGFTSEATVLLSKPVGSRAVIDAATGLPRPRWSGASGASTSDEWTHLTGDGLQS